jgi:putative aldouronate transport system substrate-binding protein
MSRKRFSIVLVLILLITSLLGACSSAKKAAQPTDTASGSDKSTASAASPSASPELGFADSIHITGFNWGWDNPIPAEDKVLPELQKRLGLKSLISDSIKIGNYDEMGQKMQLWASTGATDWPHFLATGADNNSTMIINSLGETGKIEDLTPWLEKWPNVKKAVLPFLTKDPKDGKIYYMPQNFSDMGKSAVDQPTVWIRKDWLDQLKLPYPKTVDDFHDTLKQFKDKIKTVKGQPIVPYMAFGENFMSMLPAFFPDDSQASWYMDENGNATYGPIVHPEHMIRALKYYNQLYKEGLIDKESFSIKQGQVDEKGNSGRIGALHGAFWQMATPYNDNMKKTDPKAMFVGIPLYDSTVNTGAHKVKYAKSVYSLWSIKSGIPPEEINAFFKLLDYVLSEEGTILVKFGIEGVHWQHNADGKIETTKAFADRTQGDWNKGAHEGVDVYAFIPNYDAQYKNAAPSAPREDMKITWENLGYKYPPEMDTNIQTQVVAGKIENKKWLGQGDRYKQMVTKAVTAQNEADIDGIVAKWVQTEKALGYDNIAKERTEAAKALDSTMVK